MVIIEAPQPVCADRASGHTYDADDDRSGPTRYIHFLLNQRTIPLGRSFPACGDRDDGWCRLDTFMEVQRTKLDEARYDFSCNGDYPVVPYGSVTNGVPLVVD
jgi:hypothetical protein